jgi:hydrogenase/urease accessory protein HupE
MKVACFRLLARALMLAAGACPPLANAHEFKLDAVMNAFVKVEPGRAELVVRAPLYLFKSARFPVAGVEIDIAQSAPAIKQSLAAIEKDITVFENDRPLSASGATARLSLPSDRSFGSYEEAIRHIGEPLDPDTHIFIDQGYVDARISYPIGSTSSELSIRTTAAPELGDVLKLALRYLPPGSEGRAMVVTSLAGQVALNPTWTRAASGFVRLGIEHILTGYDHLLFLLGLLIACRTLRAMLGVVTCFTLAHSVTLALAGLRVVTLPGRLVEPVIAASIIVIGLENLRWRARASTAAATAPPGGGPPGRYLVTVIFGLMHGFGFAAALRGTGLGLEGAPILLPLFGFNLGVEIGQIAVAAVALPILWWLRTSPSFTRRGAEGTSRAVSVAISVGISAAGLVWLVQRLI